MDTAVAGQGMLAAAQGTVGSSRGHHLPSPRPRHHRWPHPLPRRLSGHQRCPRNQVRLACGHPFATCGSRLPLWCAVVAPELAAASALPAVLLLHDSTANACQAARLPGPSCAGQSTAGCWSCSSIGQGIPLPCLPMSSSRPGYTSSATPPPCNLMLLFGAQLIRAAAARAYLPQGSGLARSAARPTRAFRSGAGSAAHRSRRTCPCLAARPACCPTCPPKWATGSAPTPR